MADIVVKTNSGNETYTGIESVTFNTTQEGVKATFIAQKQADWLQNDETAVDYIKNKPFYENGDTVVKLDNKYLNILEEENVDENVILAEIEIFFDAGETTHDPIGLVAGNTYKIIWNSVEYVDVAKQENVLGYDAVIVGNLALVGATEPTDFPFLFGDVPEMGVSYFVSEDPETASHTVAIYQATTASYKINKSYLPDDIGKQSDWNQTDDTAVDFIKNKPEGLATKTYVQEQIAAIDIPEAPEQVQSDWNESDETSKAFVQNRPFYVLGDWVKEMTGTFTIDKYAQNYIRSSAVQYSSLPAEGDVFKVVWDGTEYECIVTMQPVTNFASVGVIGNPKIIVEYYGNQVTASDTGEPFCFAQGFGNVYTRSAAASHTFRVYYKDNVVKLDEKFIPASVKLPSVTTDDNGKALIVTNGEWVVSELEDETQADWNETDETSKAFILNKPEIPSIEGLATEDFVKEQIAAIEIPEGGGSSGSVSTEKVILEELSFDSLFLNNYGAYGNGFNFDDTDDTIPAFSLALGDECVVVWDGTQYNVTVSDASSVMANALFVGNGSGYGLSGNNEPFCIAWTNDGVTIFAITDTEPTKHTVRIYQKLPLTVSWENVTDKPFDEKIVTIFEGTFQDSLIDNDGDGVYEAWAGETMLEDSSSTTLVVGQTYIVTWNGIEYECECGSAQGLPYIGNSIMATGNSNNIPFIIARDATGMMGAGQIWYLVIIEPPTDITASGIYDIKIADKNIKYLDNKYLSILEKTMSKETEILPETSVAFNGGQGVTNQVLSIERGNTCRIIWDGTEYILPAKETIYDGVNVIYCGNLAIMDIGPDTGEPFIIGYAPSINMSILSIQSTEESTHTIQISQIIPEKYVLKAEHIGSVDYEASVINKPFGEVAPTGTVVVDYSAIYDQTEFGFLLTNIETGERYVNISALVEGATYSVEIAGAIYEGVGMIAEAIKQIVPSTEEVVMNDVGIVIYQDGSPWGALMSHMSILWFICPIEKDSFTNGDGYQIKITVVDAIKKIDTKYIPDSVKLPAATAEDNNKFLRIVDGIPTWVSLTDVSTEGA